MASSSVWTTKQKKKFENALAIYDKDNPRSVAELGQGSGRKNSGRSEKAQ